MLQLDVLMQLEDADGAHAAAEAALELALDFTVDRSLVIELRVAAARFLAGAGLVEAALDALGSEPPELDVGLPSQELPLALEAVRILGRSGANPAALVRWATAVLRHDRTGDDARRRAARAEVDAWHAAASGRLSESSRLAQRAVALWLDAGRPREAQVAELLVQHAPDTYGPRVSLVAESDAFAVLTPREREIARFVAGGLTNPEIAAELHLSPRTVEHHVGAILRKLELTSRRELVRGRA